MRLTLWTRHRRYTAQERWTLSPLNGFGLDKDLLAVSDLQFGGHYHPIPEPQKRWFARFKRWMARAAVKIEAQGLPATFYAFPSALALLKQGVPYYARGVQLDLPSPHWDTSKR